MSVVDAHNSSTTALPANGTFTGEWYNVLHYASTVVSVVVDQPSASLGLKLQWSSDGENVDHMREHTMSSGGDALDFMHIAKHFRLTYENGDTAQSTMRMQTIHRKHGSKETASSVGGETTPDSVIDTFNSSYKPLRAGEMLTGKWLNVLSYSMMTLMITPSVPSAEQGLCMEFSHNGENTARVKTVSVPASGGAHTLTHIAKYFRIRYINGPEDSERFILQIIHHRNKNKALTSTVTQEIGDSSDVENVRAVIVGKNSGGQYNNVSIGGENSLNVAVTQPTTSFGELSVAQPHMYIQSAFVYNQVNPQMWMKDIGNGGNVDVIDSLCRLSIDGTIGAYAKLRTRKNIHYSPGQGLGCRFTPIFNTGTAGSVQTAGVVAPGDGIGFGFNGERYGIFRKRGGKQEIQRLHVTSAATTPQTVTVVLSEGIHNVPIEPGTVEFVAHQLSIHDYGPTYRTEHHDSTVMYIHCGTILMRDLYTMDSDGDVRGAFELVTAGVEPVINWTYQEDFNVDKLDGTGPSRMQINPGTGNVCQITYHWLGFGNFTYSVENPQNGRFIICHREKYANANIVLSMSTPSMPIEFSIQSITSSTPMSLRIGSVCGYVEGESGLDGPEYSVRGTKRWRTTPFRPKNYDQNILSLVNGRIFRGQSNFSVLIPESISVTTHATKDVIITVIINPEHIGADTADDHHVYQYKDIEHSVALYDTKALSVRGGVILEEHRLKGKDSINIDMSWHNVQLESTQCLVVRGQVDGYGTGDVSATIKWKEIH